MNYGRVEKNQAYREKLTEIANEKGNEYLYKKLESLDPETSRRYHPNEVNRIIRALEIYKVSGQIPSKIRTGERKLNDKLDPLIFFLNYDDRDLLYNRINQRVLDMLNLGLVDEVRELIKRFNLDNKSQSMSAIGYKEVLDYLNHDINLDEMIDLIQKNTRHYAKRQITWMKKYLNYPFTYEIKMDELNKKDASDIILSIVKEVYEL